MNLSVFEIKNSDGLFEEKCKIYSDFQRDSLLFGLLVYG